MADNHKLKVLIFGIDGADPRIIKYGIQNGIFPNIAKLLNGGVFNTLRCTWPPHTSTGWPSLFSGRLPGDHGIFHFWDCQHRAYQLEATPSTAIQVPQLWDYFQELGWKMGLVNIPMSHPAGPWDGFQFTSPLIKTLHYCQPPNLIRALRAAGGLHLPDIAYMYNGEEDYPQIARSLIQKRTKGIQYLLSQHQVDVLTVVYPEVDRVSHHYWDGLDTKHPAHATASNTDRRSIIEVYQAMDTALGNLSQEVEKDGVIMLVSDHGFGPGIKGFRLHKVLEAAGYCAFQSKETDGRTSGIEEVSGRINVLEQFDWSKTRAYIPAPGSFGLNLNIKGRQVAGIIEAVEVSEMQAELIRFLESLEDPAKNQKVFKKVLRAKDCFAASFLDRAPDLILVPNDPSLIVLSGVEGKVWDTSPQLGLHRMEGVCMIKAPKTEYILPQEQIIPIEDVAALLLNALNLPPKYFGEKPKAAMELSLLEKSWSSSQDSPLDLENSLPSMNQEIPQPSEDMDFVMPGNNELILERLRGLGYID